MHCCSAAAEIFLKACLEKRELQLVLLGQLVESLQSVRHVVLCDHLAIYHEPFCVGEEVRRGVEACFEPGVLQHLGDLEGHRALSVRPSDMHILHVVLRVSQKLVHEIQRLENERERDW